jgi:hypothetical protein
LHDDKSRDASAFDISIARAWAKDSEVVVKHAETKGVRTLDWQERRAEANRALMEQREWRRVGFRRLDERLPTETETMHSAGLTALKDNRKEPETK